MGHERFVDSVEHQLYAICKKVTLRQETDHQAAVVSKSEQVAGVDGDPMPL